MTALSSIDSHASESARDQIRRKIASDPDLPGLGSAVSQVVQLASSNDQAVRKLAHFVLSDAAMTQKILRLANTVAYRNASGNAVTTISRAIFLLGFDAVKTSALAMLLVDGMSGAHAQNVRAELSQALCASVVGREMARRSSFKDSEEAAVAALFKNMGQLLVAAHDHRSYCDITARMTRDSITPAKAATQVLGCSFDTLAESVLRDWSIPESIINALAPLPRGPLKPARNRNEWMQQVSAFSAAAADVIANIGVGTNALATESEDPVTNAACEALLARFGAALEIDHTAMVALFATVAEQTHVLSRSSNLAAAESVDEDFPPPDTLNDQQTTDSFTGHAARVTDMTGAVSATAAIESTGLPSDILMGDKPNLGLHVGAHPSGKPFNARELLLAGVQDVSEMMASGHCKVSDLALLVLETLSRSMGFRFATICVRDLKSGHYRSRVALGENHSARQTQFIFSVNGEHDLFSLALKNDADLLISDATAANISALIPAWHRLVLPDARSFIVLPLVVRGKPLGLLYGDRIALAPEGIPSDEAALIKTLKGQMTAALTSH